MEEMISPGFHPALPLAALVESSHNPRKTFAQAQLEELADSIQERVLAGGEISSDDAPAADAAHDADAEVG